MLFLSWEMGTNYCSLKGLGVEVLIAKTWYTLNVCRWVPSTPVHHVSKHQIHHCVHMLGSVAFVCCTMLQCFPTTTTACASPASSYFRRDGALFQGWSSTLNTIASFTTRCILYLARKWTRHSYQAFAILLFGGPSQAINSSSGDQTRLLPE